MLMIAATITLAAFVVARLGEAAPTNYAGDSKPSASESARILADKIQVAGKWFVDGQGRVRFFHGINQVRKSFPWYPDSLFNDTFVENLRAWGFNVVRLGTMWSGLEIGSYQYNETYLAVIKALVDRLSSRGIYVIFDMHQDGLSSVFGQYDGMPLWLLEQFQPAKHSFPWPFLRIAAWFEAYLTEACSYAFQQLYDNVSDAVGHLREFWRKIAAAFADNPFVLGYELINEPWAGNIYADPLLLLPGEAGRRNLMPLYDELSAAIRQVDNESIVFYEPVTWGVAFNGQISGTGFDRVPGGDAYRNRSALAYHYYCWIVSQENRAAFAAFHELGDADLPLHALCDDFVMPLMFDTVRRDIDMLGGASFLTEFGICTPASNVSRLPCEPVVMAAYTYLQSWAYWDAVFYDDSGQVMWNVVEVFSRPYAQAVAGVPQEMAYDPRSGTFKLTYVCGSNVGADYFSDGEHPPPTEIYASKLHYPEGYQVVTSPGLQWYQDGDKLYVIAPPSFVGVSQPCSVELIRLHSDSDSGRPR